MAEDVRGRFLWYELMTTDPKAAQAFYTKLLGWGTQAWEGGPTPYTMFTLAGQPLAGVMELPEEARKGGARPHWIPYMGTANVDATVQQAERLGAKVFVPPTDIPTVGRFAVLGDPAGAIFAVYTPSRATAPANDIRPGDFSWHELASTAEAEASFNFYSALFGWSKTTAFDMGPMGPYQLYGHGGRELGGMFKKPAEMPGPPAWMLYVRVDDVKPKAEEVKSLGGQILNGPMEVPGGDWIVNCMDPQGAVFSLHSLKK